MNFVVFDKQTKGDRQVIDIHNHTLFGVDDGPETIEESIEMLSQAKRQGVDAVIFTPHYRHGMFAYPKDRITDHFEQLQNVAEDFGVMIYLGCEYHVDSYMVEAFQNEKCFPLADGDYVLTEYSHDTEYSYIVQNTQKLIHCGYIPVIAHAERYRCFFSAPKRCGEIQNMGAFIQLNADDVLGKAGWQMAHVCKKVLKNEWADLIASDAHGVTERASHLGECRALILKKYGHEYADRLFYENAKKIIECGRQ